MSLINEMLRNLERRTIVDTNPQAVLIGLNSTLSGGIKKNGQLYLFFLAIFILLMFFYFLLGGAQKHQTIALPLNETFTSTPFLENPSPILDAALTGISLQMQKDTTYLKFLLNKKAFYHINSLPQEKKIIIIFENTQLAAPLPKVNYSLSGIDNITAFNEPNGNLKVILQLNTSAEMKGLADQNGSDLQLEVLYATNTDKVLQNNGTIPVTINKPIIESNRLVQYKEAMSLSASGQKGAAIAALKKMLIQYPNDVLARQSLIQLLLDQGKKTEATIILDVGLEMQPNNPKLIELKAQMLVAENKISDALNLLERAAPSITSQPRYHAFIAALYQREGQPVLAASLYKQLLMVQPNNSTWWLGLGVALETQGDQKSARVAYARAENIGGLNPELKAYIETKLRGVG